MSFNSFGSSIKLNSVKTYNGVNTSANTSFKNAFYSDIEDIDYSKYEEIDYNSLDLEKGIEEAKEKANEQPWYKTIFDYTQTIRSSFNWGILEVVENIGDGLIMLGSASMAVRASVVDSIFGTSYADKIKEIASNMIAYDWTEAGYQAEMKALGVSEEIANGMAHTIAGGIGTTAGYVAMSFIPGGAAVTATAGALSAVGSSSEMAFNSGATYEETLTVSMVAAVAGGVSGGALNKIGTAARGATSLLQVGGYATAGAGVSMLEPVVNTTAQYYTYGKDMVDENGNKLYDNLGDYYVESGGALNTAIAGVAGGFSTGVQGIGGYNNYKKVYNNINNMENLDTESIQKLQKRFKQMSNEQVYNVVQNSDNEYFKSNLKTYDLITRKNAAEFIVFGGYNSDYKTANFNLDWPDHAGYDLDSITSLKTLIDSSPDGKIEVSRVGGDGGHAIGTDWNSTSSQRSIPSSSSSGTAGIFDGNKYIEAIDVCSGASDDISKVRQLMNLGYDENVAESMIKEFNSFDSLPEISGKGGLNEVLSSNQKSKYGYAGKAAHWTTPSVNMEGGAGQMNSIFSWGTLKEAGIVTDIKNVTF